MGGEWYNAVWGDLELAWKLRSNAQPIFFVYGHGDSSPDLLIRQKAIEKNNKKVAIKVILS